jgi:hypothetical protein
VYPVERQLKKRTDAEDEAMRGYCNAVRSALIDDGYPFLADSGLTLHDRLSAISTSLERSEKRGGYPSPLSGFRRFFVEV